MKLKKIKEASFSMIVYFELESYQGWIKSKAKRYLAPFICQLILHSIINCGILYIWMLVLQISSIL